MDEPFILANDVAQVFYVKDMSSKPRKKSTKEYINRWAKAPHSSFGKNKHRGSGWQDINQPRSQSTTVLFLLVLWFFFSFSFVCFSFIFIFCFIFVQNWKILNLKLVQIWKMFKCKNIQILKVFIFIKCLYSKNLQILKKEILKIEKMFNFLKYLEKNWYFKNSDVFFRKTNI
jgi:hypothetical protein